MSNLMPVWASMIVYDRFDIRLSVFASQDALREDLVQYYNEMASQEDEPYSIPDDTSLEDVLDHIRDDLNEIVQIEETVIALSEPKPAQ